MRTLLLFIMLPASSALAADGLDYDGVKFERVWAHEEKSVQLIEFIPADESLDAWERMITFQCHPEAGELKQVTGPYFAARKGLLAVRPEVFGNGSGYEQDVSLVLFLRPPGKSRYLEFVIARFFRGKAPGVYATIYSHRLPATDKADVSVAIEHKASWLKQIAAIDLPTVRDYCAAEKT